MSEELSTEVVEVSGAYPEIARKYKAGEELTDEELDTVADVAITVLRDLLAFLVAADYPI